MVVRFQLRKEGPRGGLRRSTKEGLRGGLKRSTCVVPRRSNILNLPQEIMLNILSRLPLESILDCRRVLKSWRDLLPVLNYNSTHFTDMHLHHQSQQFMCDNQYHHHPHHDHENNKLINNFNPDTKMSFVCVGEKGSIYYVEYDENNVESYRKHKKFNLQLPNDVYFGIGSCNGLICLSVNRKRFADDPVYICNPITREFLHLPRIVLNNNGEPSMAYGFGYNSFTNEYKVVRIYYDIIHSFPESVGQVQVYTLGSGIGWRNKGEINHRRFSSSGVLFNGALHWLSVEGDIVAFDLADEEFRCFPLPPCSVNRNGRKLSMWVLGGCLCIIDQHVVFNTDIWFLKKKEMQTTTTTTSSSDDDNDEGYKKKNHVYYQCWSWSREFSIRFKYISGIETPFAITKRGEILHLYKRKNIISSDLKTDARPKQLGILPNYIYGVDMISHVNSFVSLKALGENNAVIL